MNVHKPDPLEPKGGTETPEKVFFNRRRIILSTLGGAGIAGFLGWRWYQGSNDAVLAGGERDRLDNVVLKYFPGKREKRFEYGRPETHEPAAARYTNFYEFAYFKRVWANIDSFQPDPWTLTVDGLCRNPLKLDLGELLKKFAKHHTERQYRHRCVETWAMAIPWTGIPLTEIINAAGPLDKATHIRFVSFNRPDQAPMQRHSNRPWPYQEGLTLPEANNELTFLATGMYGHPLLKQHGAPMRLVVPWKYGYKSIKSIVRMEFVEYQPATYWNTIRPQEYGFESNVNPKVPHSRWSQKTEWMLGTNTRHPTQLYNGYEKYVADLYS